MQNKEIHISGTGGFGNCMFQLAAAIYYAETYNYKIKLDINSEHLHIGTANYTNRDRRRKVNGVVVSYKDTIYSNDKLEFKSLKNIKYSKIYTFNNDYMLHEPITSDSIIRIQGYCQNYKLFWPIKDSIFSYINLNDTSIIEYIHTKYQIDPTRIYTMVGLRCCSDFGHMIKIKHQSYMNAINHLLEGKDKSKHTLFIITDSVELIHTRFKIPDDLDVKIIDEDDIIQIYAGMVCSNFILSESTYHYWIALLKYIKDPTVNIICFKDTDITNRPLALPDWVQISY
jgi:hypothetical protein